MRLRARDILAFPPHPHFFWSLIALEATSIASLASLLLPAFIASSAISRLAPTMKLSASHSCFVPFLPAVPFGFATLIPPSIGRRGPVDGTPRFVQANGVEARLRIKGPIQIGRNSTISIHASAR